MSETKRGAHSCGGCDNRWNGLAACHCSGCHETFSSVSGFDRHRRGGECLKPAEIGLVRDGRGSWSFPGPKVAHFLDATAARAK